MVYENLSISTEQLRLLPSECGPHLEEQATEYFDNQPTITTTIRTLPVQILSTCRLVHSEALPFLSRKLDKISETTPRIIVDADCLYTSAFGNMQHLLCTVLDNLNQHPFFSTKSATASPPFKHIQKQPQYPKAVHQWFTQTTYLLLSQRPIICPLSGFMGTRTYPTVRIVIEVPKVWRQSAYRGLAIEPRAHDGERPVYTASITSMLSQMWTGLADHTKGLEHVKGGAIVFGQDLGQEDERVVTKEGLVVTKMAALDFGICRVFEQTS